MTVEKACGYIREALEEMGFTVRYGGDGWARWRLIGVRDPNEGKAMPNTAYKLLLALDSLDPMGTTYKEEG